MLFSLHTETPQEFASEDWFSLSTGFISDGFCCALKHIVEGIVVPHES
jgi:hypothetical protein